MKSTTAALFLSILSMLALLVNVVLHASSVLLLKDETDPKLVQSRTLLLGTAIIEAVFVVFLFVMIIYIFRNSVANVWSYLLLFLSGSTIFASGVISALVASQLQCSVANQAVKEAWQYTASGAASGIIATVLLLVIQGFASKGSNCAAPAQK